MQPMRAGDPAHLADQQSGQDRRAARDEGGAEMLGVPGAMLRQHGAVSETVARAMAEGAIRNSTAQLSIAVTGIAGPGGGTDEKPVGLVHIAAARAGEATLHRECRFGDIGRSDIRLATVVAALELLQS